MFSAHNQGVKHRDEVINLLVNCVLLEDVFNKKRTMIRKLESLPGNHFQIVLSEKRSNRCLLYHSKLKGLNFMEATGEK